MWGKYKTSSIEGHLADWRAYAVERGYTMAGEYFEEPNKPNILR